MMLGIVKCIMEVYWIKIKLVIGDFEMEVDVMKVDKLQLMMVENFCYKSFLEKYLYFKGVIMDDIDYKFCLLVYFIFGNSECFRISILEL